MTGSEAVDINAESDGFVALLYCLQSFEICSDALERTSGIIQQSMGYTGSL